VSGRLSPSVPGGGVLTLVVVGAAMATFGLVGGLAGVLGPAVGLAGIAASASWRRWRPVSGRSLAVVPALVALGALALTSPAGPSPELFGGVASLAVLLWLADDPSRPAGGGRRASPALAVCAAGMAIAWVLAVGLPAAPPEIGIAGGLLAFVILLLAVLLEHRGTVRSSGAG
jgi:hypothetical protein